MPRRYAVLDVFTRTPLAGNPLAVVLDSDGLDDGRMQAIAAEFNLSETVFVQPPENGAHSAAIRIFTPRRELPFAGHPTVGTAVLLALEGVKAGRSGADAMVVLEERVGPVRCGVMLDDERHGHAVFDLPRLPSPTNDPADRTAVAMALDLSPAELGFENHEPTGFEAGVPYAFVPVRDLAIIARARPQQGHFARAFGENQSVYVYTRETVGNEHHFHGRMFAPALGFYEDPATGSAIAAFAGVIRRFDTPPDGSHRYVIEQGFEMRRPSLIRLELDIENGTLAGARIGGDAVVIAAGTLDA